jgi:hypothetical protein
MESKKPVAPIWYDTAEVRGWLRSEDNDDLVNFLAYHLQKAFEKGWEMGYRTGRKTEGK